MAIPPRFAGRVEVITSARTGAMSDSSEAKPPPADEAEAKVPEEEPHPLSSKPAGGGKNGKKGGKRQRKNNLAARRAIDTMFRGAYREQLDLTALADSKANIMIQLNGVIVSIMLASSGVVMDSHPWLRLPSAALTLTALIAILFAVLAARPNLDKRTPMTFEDLRSGKANILFFGNFARVSEEQFVEGMWEMFRTPEEVYRNMTRHVHGLGTVLLRKFRLLRVAYTVFLTGLCLSSALFLFSLSAYAGDSARSKTTPLETTGFNLLAGMYEPSGVVQLPDGRLLVVEDEPERSMALLTLSPTGRLTVDSGIDLRALLTAQDPALRNLDDLEGAAIDGEGVVYAVTSFATGDESRPNREKLVRLELEGGALRSAQVRTDLREALARRVDGPLNIEGLAFDRRERRLLLGLRTPLKDGKALVIPIDQSGLFDDAPRIGAPITLELEQDGIRAMAYDAELGGLVIIGAREDGDHPFHMWLWDGQSDPRRIEIEGIDLRRAEGITPIVIDGEKRLLVVSDEGKRKKGKAAGYILLRYDQLSVES